MSCQSIGYQPSAVGYQRNGYRLLETISYQQRACFACVPQVYQKPLLLTADG